MLIDKQFTNTEKEYSEIKDFLERMKEIRDFDDCWDPGRMDWWRYNYHAEKLVDFFMENTHYWKDGDKVIGLFISEYGKNDFFAVADPSYENLLTEILEWGEKVWAEDKDEIITSIFSYDKDKINSFKDRNYVEAGQDGNLYFYDLTDYDFEYELKSGFEIKTFFEYRNYEQRVEVARNSFNNPNISETKVRSLQSSPEYNKDLELLTITPEGKAAGYCIGWAEEKDKTKGYIEPIGVHSDYRKMGFGKAMAKEAFKRLKNLGVETATIASAAEPEVSNYLYKSLKPFNVQRMFNYKKVLKK